MTVDEFRELLDRYGGDLSRWPPRHVVEGSHFLALSLEAQALLDETVAMEMALAEQGGDMPADLARRIFDAAFADDEDAAIPNRPAAPR